MEYPAAMNLVSLLARYESMPRKRVVAAAVVSGVGGAVILALVNMAAAEIAKSGRSQVDWELAAAFAAAIVAYAAAELFVIARVCGALEAAIHQVRVRLLERLLRADFEKVERIGQVVFYESITQATQTISQHSQFLALALRSLVLVIAILAYIAYVSTTAFLLVLLATLAGGLVYSRAGRHLGTGYAAMMDQEKRLFESVSDLLDGFKEIRLSSARSRDLAAVFGDISRSATAIRTDVQMRAIQQFVLGQVAVFFLLAVVVFVAPLYAPGFRDNVVQVTTSVLFMTGAIGALIQTVPLLGAAEAAAVRMTQLDGLLAEMEDPEAQEDGEPLPAGFTEVALRGVAYAYPAAAGEEGFALGPVDLVLRRGEIVLITGGNGSGKSTLIKLLTGLYRPQEGAIRVDGVAVGPRTRRAYRDLVSAVFADYHLFPRLYGEIDAAEAQSLLGWFEMDRVTRLIGDRFERLDLSAGQRKRLALMAALLEARPLLVLDEWAADQDPHFRRKFYREILPTLKARGITVVAVTHDDAYFDVADRRFHLEEGRLSELTVERREDR